MGEWAPVVAGFGFIALVLLLARLFPRAEWVADLARLRGLRASGAGGEVLPRDCFRSAGWALLVAGLLFGLSVASHAIAERFATSSRGNLIASVYFFTLFLLSGLAAVYAVQMAGVGAWLAWRRRREQP